MHNYNLKIATYFLILVGAIATTILGVKSMNYPITFTALGFIAWAVSPSAYLTANGKTCLNTCSNIDGISFFAANQLIRAFAYY